MKKIKVKYLDWWEGFEPENYLINELLRKHYDVEESEDPDYVICSMFSRKALDYDCIRIFYSGENFCPDFNLFDYAFGFEKMNYGDRYVYCPNYILNPKYKDDVERMIHKHENQSLAGKSEFCSFVVSNGLGNPIRFNFFSELSKYNKVNSGGRFLNNIGAPNGVPDKYEFQKKHKFSICFENSSHKGYVTEKIVQGFAAGTIPIYWGAVDVGDIFNKNSMIIVKDSNDFARAIQQIKEIDNDDELYLSMLGEPALVYPEAINKMIKDLENFLVNIFEQPLEQAERRPHGEAVKVYYQNFLGKGKGMKGLFKKGK
ncbi:MAG: glycosyltransferase family 10 domain-containing protein [Agathobacter sp.]